MTKPKRRLKWRATRYDSGHYTVSEYCKGHWWAFSTLSNRRAGGLSQTFQSLKDAKHACEKHARERRGK